METFASRSTPWLFLKRSYKEMDMHKNPWYEKYSFLVFLLIAGIGMAQAVQMMVAPEAGRSLLAGFGYPIPDALINDPDGSVFYLRYSSMSAVTLMATGYFALSVVETGTLR